jgi:Tfp pilus assembly protein PilN
VEDDAVRAQLRARFHATADPLERREILLASMAQVDRQVGSLQGKVARLTAMIDEAFARRAHLQQRLDALASAETAGTADDEGSGR